MRFKKYLEETTTTGDVAKNLAQGHVDVIGAPKYKKKKKKNNLDKRGYNVHETSVSSDVTGSQQTRVAGDYGQSISVLKRQPRPLKFNKLLGAYLPLLEEPEEQEEVQENKGVSVEDIANSLMKNHKMDKKKAMKKAKEIYNQRYGKKGKVDFFGLEGLPEAITEITSNRSRDPKEDEVRNYKNVRRKRNG